MFFAVPVLSLLWIANINPSFSIAEFQKKVLFLLSGMWHGIKQILQKLDHSNNGSKVEFEIKRMNPIAEVQGYEELLQDPEIRKLQ